MKKFDYIDALRGYAILGVIAAHSAQSVPALDGALAAVAASGQYGVQLFFVTSALTLMLSWRARDDGAPAFYIRRLFRIVPMFWLAIVAGLLVNGWGPRFWAPDGVTWSDIVSAALLLHGWFPEAVNGVVPGGWSIAAEVGFYVVFPLLAARIRSPVAAGAALLGSLIAAKIGVVVLAWAYHSEPHPQLYFAAVHQSFFVQMPVFVIGICTYFAITRVQAPKHTAATVLVAAVAGFLAPPYAPAVGPPHFYFAVTAALFAYALANGAGGRLLVNRPVCWLGKISYSAYFWHFAVIAALGFLGLVSPWPAVDFAATFTVAIAVTAGLSTVTYTFIEMRMNRYGAQIAAHISASDADHRPVRVVIPDQHLI